jgi:hypothetical protein
MLLRNLRARGTTFEFKYFRELESKYEIILSLYQGALLCGVDSCRIKITNKKARVTVRLREGVSIKFWLQAQHPAEQPAAGG